MRIVTAAIAATMFTQVAAAQGTVGGQGFGYPVIQQSARAAGTGGAMAAFDELSPVNPAPLAQWTRMVLFTQIEPEIRRTTAGGSGASTRLSRFPLTGVAAPLGSRGAISLAASTYLDRTWETVATSRDEVGGRAVDVTTSYSSSGAINDVRAAVAWAFTPALRVGVGYHAYTGSNRMKIDWNFPENEPFGDVSQSSTIAYSGNAFSAGVDWRPTTQFGIAAYQRVGGAGRVRAGDTLVTEGDMPNHTGLALRYDGITGTIVAAAWEHIGWTAMRGLATSDLAVRDANRVSLGIETGGPRLGATPLAVRIGVAQRTLPFDAAGEAVSERLLSFGAGYPFGAGRGSANLAVQRAWRDAGSAAERAWLISIGFTLSP